MYITGSKPYITLLSVSKWLIVLNSDFVICFNTFFTTVVRLCLTGYHNRLVN